MRQAFTLIELLVVIAIVTLLVGILLPVLGQARESARSAVCLAHQRSTGVGLHVYLAEHDEWLPGPNTSGYRFGPTTGDVPSYTPDSPSTPATNMDWVSPTLGDALGLSPVPIDRMVEILNTKLCCPSDDRRYDYVYPEEAWAYFPNPDELYVASYSATIEFQYIWRAPARLTFYDPLNHSRVRRIDITKVYQPRMPMIGPPSNKVWVCEGSRYYDPTQGTSFNTFTWQRQGGNYMLSGPASPRSGDPHMFDANGQPTAISQQLAYRHSRGMNMTYFDGHATHVSAAESRDPGLWMPAGMRMLGASVP